VEQQNIIHFLYVPFTGLGLYNGYRGDKWLKNRITIFKEYTMPSILNQNNHNFYLLISWRPEERDNPIVKEFEKYMASFRDLKTIFTYDGIMFWDDKYPDDEAEQRVRNSLGGTLPQLNIAEDVVWVYLTIQPSDDMYLYNTVDKIQEIEPDKKAIGFKRGYIINMNKKEVSEYNPTTTPPFYTVIFPRDVFLDPNKHFEYIGKCKSHEYVGNFLPYHLFEERGFVVGTHGENISTTYNIPFRGRKLGPGETGDVLRMTGIHDAPPLKLVRGPKRLYFKLPHKVRRKLRYWLGERFFAKLHKWLNR